jgi:NADP-dependent 3-hydroxy acid dehydrogenase YdfG
MKTAFITGATAGFGKAIAYALAKEGYRIIITGRRRSRLEQIAADFDTGQAYPLPFDIRYKDEVEAAVKSLPPEWQNIDVLINNAGLALGKSNIENGETSDWDGMLDTNVKGLLYMTRALLPLLKNSDSAHIINIGSIAGTEVYPGGNVYCASKHAVNAISKSLRMELLPYKIRVSQIKPGLAETEFSMVRFKGDDSKASKVYDGYEPLLAEDIARATSFILNTPVHACINDLEITPTAQANAFMIEKGK